MMVFLKKPIAIDVDARVFTNLRGDDRTFLGCDLVGFECYGKNRPTGIVRDRASGGLYHDVPLDRIESPFLAGVPREPPSVFERVYQPGTGGALSVAEFPEPQLVQVFGRDGTVAEWASAHLALSWEDGNQVLYFVMSSYGVRLWPPHKLLFEEASPAQPLAPTALPAWEKKRWSSDAFADLAFTRVSVDEAALEAQVLARLALLCMDRSDWRVHGMGVAQASLTDELRVHVWHRSFRCEDRRREFAHSHRFPLAARVVTGAIEQREYGIHPHFATPLGEAPWTSPWARCGAADPDDKGQEYDLWAHGNSDLGHRTPDRLTGPFERFLVGKARIPAGYVYEMPGPSPSNPDGFRIAIHETVADDFTVTLVRRGPRRGRSVALIPVDTAPQHGLDMMADVDPWPVLREALERLTTGLEVGLKVGLKTTGGTRHGP